MRKAAEGSGITSTWWGKFEDGIQPLTDGIAAAVARRFKWPANWANLPVENDPVAVLQERVRVLATVVYLHSVALADLGADVLPASELLESSIEDSR